MAEGLPVRIDRAAVERVIQRAAELQTGEREIGDSLTQDEVVALGKEVGIPERYLRQALIEERGKGHLLAPAGLLDRIFGPGTAGAERVVHGEGPAIAATLLDWMDRSELLTVQRQQPARIVWEPARGVGAVLRKSSAALAGNRSIMLSNAQSVTATITDLEPGYCHVALTADLTHRRNGQVAGSGALAASGFIAAAVLGVMTPFWLVAAIPVPVFLGLSLAVGRLYRPIAERTQLGLERALDQLEGGTRAAHTLPPRAGLLSAVLDEVRRAMR
ncbi:MAG TPA: hypothetical protein VMG41_03730 [Gemmatimonadales bacterium]|nr:hypothetical protein [Gemmatimonadales bacterium]